MEPGVSLTEPEQIGPYVVYDEIGCGGMARVHIAQLQSLTGFSRIVAVKRMYPELARSAHFVRMFLEEVRISGRIQHPNVVAALDAVAQRHVVALVMEYVHGVSLDAAVVAAADRRERIPVPIASAILTGTLMGLHAAHGAVDLHGANLRIVHRDISPHNVLVGRDGLPRVLDFGIAKAAQRVRTTRTGEVKGKIAYMAPEQLLNEDIGPSADIYSAGVILWELLVGRPLFDGGPQAMMRVANNEIPRPREICEDISPELEAVVMKAVARDPSDRYEDALEFAKALEATASPAYPLAVGEWIQGLAGARLRELSALRARVEGFTPSVRRVVSGGPPVDLKSWPSAAGRSHPSAPTKPGTPTDSGTGAVVIPKHKYAGWGVASVTLVAGIGSALMLRPVSPHSQPDVALRAVHHSSAEALPPPARSSTAATPEGTAPAAQERVLVTTAGPLSGIVPVGDIAEAPTMREGASAVDRGEGAAPRPTSKLAVPKPVVLTQQSQDPKAPEAEMRPTDFGILGGRE